MSKSARLRSATAPRMCERSLNRRRNLMKESRGVFPTTLSIPASDVEFSKYVPMKQQHEITRPCNGLSCG